METGTFSTWLLKAMILLILLIILLVMLRIHLKGILYSKRCESFKETIKSSNILFVFDYNCCLIGTEVVHYKSLLRKKNT